MKQKSPSFRKYCIAIIILFLMYIWLPQLFPTPTSPFEGLVSMTVVCFLPNVFFTQYLLHDFRLTLFVNIAFLVKIIIGVVHYLYFLDPMYFSNTGDISTSGLHHEFQFVYGAVNDVILIKKQYGLFYIASVEDLHMPHAEIWSIISIPFVFLKNYVLNITPVNSLASSIIAINLILIAKKVGYTSYLNTLKWVAVWFPMFLLCDIYYRDAFGIALLSIGITMIVTAQMFSEKIIAILLACVFAFLLRSFYPIAILGSLAICQFIKVQNKIWGIIVVLMLAVGGLYMFSFANMYQSEGYFEDSVKLVSLIMLPVKIFAGLIGPFPWTQFAKYKEIPAFSFQLSDYILGTFQFSIILLLIFRRSYINFKIMDFPTIAGLLLLLMGIINPYMHIVYVAVGFIFIIPWIVENGQPFMKGMFMKSFMFLLGLTLLSTIVGQFGLSQLWR